MTAALRDAQRAIACNVFRRVSPESPTLCEGWSAYDLATHLWTLDHDPLAWPAIGIGALSSWERKRFDRIQQRLPYPALIDQLAAGRGSFACMPTDRFEDYRHSLGEWFVHTEDVRRANGISKPDYPDDLQVAFWLRLQAAAKALFPLRGIRFVTTSGATGRTGRGAIETTVTGEPAELLLWAYGRRDAADVELS